MCPFTFWDCLLWLAAAVVVLAVLIKLYLCHAGTEIIVPQVKSRSKFIVDEQTEESMSISTVIEFVNEGKQCATIMDAFVRPQLPYEQYDGLETRGHAELVTAPREDDYFEAYIIQKKGYKDGLDRASIKCQVKLTARRGMSIKEAVAHMPDFNFQLIWLETGRTPCHYRQLRVEVPAAEVAALAGTELAQDQD